MSADRRVTTAPRAGRDIRAAFLWLTQEGAGIRAERRLSRLIAALSELEKHPCRHPVGRHRGTRERSVSGYRIVYRVRPDTGDDETGGDVTVLRVFGPGQDRSRS